MQLPVLLTPLLASAVLAAPGPSERILRLDVDLTVRRDATLEVTETIAYDFGADAFEKHGIYRTIPVFVSGEGGARKLRTSVQSVRDEQGAPYEYAASTYSGGERVIQIGDPDVTVTGVKTYVLRYTVQRAPVAAADVGTGPYAGTGRDVLLWNAIGTGWDVPILAGATTVRVEGATSPPDVTCLTGREGEIGADCAVEPEGDRRVVTLTRALGAFEGLTVHERWPSGITAFPTGWRKLVHEHVDDWGALALAVVVLAAVVLSVRVGRDAPGARVVVTQFELPAGLNPAEVGTLRDEVANDRDLTALIVDLAARGYLRIAEVRDDPRGKVTDYHFTRTHDADDRLDELEARLFRRLFRDGPDVRVSELKERMADTWQDIRSTIYQSLTERGYFRANPRTVRGVALGAAGAFAFGAVFAAIAALAGGPYTSLLTGGSLLVAAAVIALTAFTLPARTAKGVEALQHVRGLERYLTVAEEARLRFEEAEQRYSRLLPAALALGVAAQWTARFAGLLTAPPNWYSGQTTFDPTGFTRSLAAFAATTGSSLSSAPASSGGGGSGGGVGGGGGGGGGGSW